MNEWKVVSSRRDRETPCSHCLVRVKIAEPGVQSRYCRRCDETFWFKLEEGTDRWRGMLFMRWITEAEARQIQAEMEEATELAIGLDLDSLLS